MLVGVLLHQAEVLVVGVISDISRAVSDLLEGVYHHDANVGERRQLGVELVEERPG